MTPRSTPKRPKTDPRGTWKPSYVMFSCMFDVDPCWAPFRPPLGLGPQNRSKIDPKIKSNIKLCQHTPKRALQEAPRLPPDTLPRELQDRPMRLPRPSQEALRETQSLSRPPKAAQLGADSQRPYEVASLLSVICCPSMLNRIQFIIQLCIGSSQETIENIQELSKTNILEPPSFQASLPLSLQMPAAKRLGGIREAQTICSYRPSLKNELLKNRKFKDYRSSSYYWPPDLSRS